MDDDMMMIDDWAIGEAGRASAEVRPGAPVAPAGWPDTAVDAADVAGLELRAASVRGLLHRRFGMPRQDSYSLVWQRESDALIVTVCDGLGSFDLSHEAADLVARRLAAVLERDADTGRLGWVDAFGTVSGELVRHIEARGEDMATTVVCARITATVQARYQAELAWVGDSAAFLLTQDGWEVVGGSVKTADAENDPLASATQALPGDTFEVHTNIVEFGSGSALFLMSDGVADALAGGYGEVGEELGSWWTLPPDQFTFAAQTAFARKSFDDDRTVVGIWTPSASEAV